MTKIVTSERVPIKLWLKDYEDQALEQAKNLASLPFAFKHIAIMPDSHTGYGMPIGGVLATLGALVPNAVGVDIGCGVLARELKLEEMPHSSLEEIIGLIRERIPVGFNWHEEPRSSAYMPSRCLDDLSIIPQYYEKARLQLGTLGGGNHFIEIQKSEQTGNLWIMIHSGSRNLGKQVADHYNKRAQELNAMWYSSVDPKHDLAYFPLQSLEATEYYKEMEWCVDYAKANREVMLYDILNIFQEVLGVQLEYGIHLNKVHNDARWEHHYKHNVVIHRKGACRAYLDEKIPIPGSMGTCSYIARGLGNAESFKSSSHGAGRKLGRKEARRTLDLVVEQAYLDDRGIVHGLKSVEGLDEAPGSYKDIDEVMRLQADLVEVLEKLQPLGVVKG